MYDAQGERLADIAEVYQKLHLKLADHGAKYAHVKTVLLSLIIPWFAAVDPAAGAKPERRCPVPARTTRLCIPPPTSGIPPPASQPRGILADCPGAILTSSGKGR